MVADMDDSDRDHLMNIVKKTPKRQHASKHELINDIHDYYQRDDISRASPKIDDVKTYKLPQSNEEVLLPKRHMILTLKESFAMFIEERNETGMGVWHFTCNIQCFKLIEDSTEWNFFFQKRAVWISSGHIDHKTSN